MKPKETPEDICRLAKMMIDEYSDHAAEHAMGHALEMRSRRDLNGEVVWLKVFDSIKALQERGIENKTLH
ncbi:MAG: hypothetical protein ACP5M5_13400 [Acidibrevibacterium sp.]|uniref:hypothetical protein n=1 Tax=Acidibrevibacterium sp. TaxID=2606776 RepID=UPI003CFDAAE6